MQIKLPIDGVAQRFHLGENEAIELFFAQIVGDKAQARRVLVAAVARAVENLLGRLGEQECLFGGQEIEESIAKPHFCAHAAGEIHDKAAFAVFDCRDEANIGDGRNGAVGAARAKRNLEFAREIIGIFEREHLGRERVGIGRDVEWLIGRDSGERVGDNVAHGVAAAAAPAKPQSHDFFGQSYEVVIFGIVQLHAAARCDVQERVGVFTRELCEPAQLLGRDRACRAFEAEHVGVGLALFVDSKRNADCLECECV